MVTKLDRERATGIGGSDAPVLCGVARWKTPYQLWVEKTAALRGDFGVAGGDEDDNDLLLWGTLMEPKILKVYGERTERKIITRVPLIRHPDMDWLIAHLDGKQKDQDLGEGIVEAKNVSRYVSDRWEEIVPLEVQVQTQHYLAATGLPYATAVGLVGGHQLIWKDIPRNDRFIEALLDKEHAFWMRVMADNPPTATAADSKFLNTLEVPTPGKVFTFDGEGTVWDDELQETLNEIEKVKAILAPLEEKRADLEARIKQRMGDAEIAMMPNGQQYTFKEVIRKEHFVKESRYRKFVRKKR